MPFQLQANEKKMLKEESAPQKKSTQKPGLAFPTSAKANTMDLLSFYEGGSKPEPKKDGLKNLLFQMPSSISTSETSLTSVLQCQKPLGNWEVSAQLLGYLSITKDSLLTKAPEAVKNVKGANLETHILKLEPWLLIYPN